MKCTIPEISWHNREPVLSVDALPVDCGDFYKVATGGSDTFICIWQLKIVESGAVTIDILSELTRHQKAVNVVRWSPNGNYLASGDDDANIIIWQLKTDNVPLLDGDTDFKETWIVNKILRGHKEDVYDISWSPNSSKLLSGSVDNTAILWDLNKGKNEIILTDHKGFVQGVAWDPKDEFIATLSSDRICRIFNPSGKQVRARISRGFLPVAEEHVFGGKDVKYFHDDTFKTFFRRLNFSPDGNLLIVPSGSIETEECKNAMYATYIFTLDSFKQPAVILPTPKQCSIVARCSPILYELRPNIKPYIDLPYRMMIAVATDSDVILYDTQQISPFAQLHNIHYTRLTDLTWSHDGLLLTATSTDGFITLVTFEKNELGFVYKKVESEEEVDKSIVAEEPEKKPVETIDEKEKERIKVKRSSFIEQWAKQTPAQKRKAEEESSNEIKKLKNENESKKQNVNTAINKNDGDVITIMDSPMKDETAVQMPEETQKKPKRITPITLKSVTPKKVKRNNSEDIKIKEHSATGSKKIGDVQDKETSIDSESTKQSQNVAKTDIGNANLVASTSSNDVDANKLQPVDSPKPRKRVQLITLRAGSEKNANPSTNNTQSCKVETAAGEMKPKKRATLIKVGECSNKAPPQASVEERFFTKLLALDKTETDEVKSSDDEKDEEKSDSEESDAEFEISEPESKCNSQGLKDKEQEKTQKEKSIEKEREETKKPEKSVDVKDKEQEKSIKKEQEENKKPEKSVDVKDKEQEKVREVKCIEKQQEEKIENSSQKPDNKPESLTQVTQSTGDDKNDNVSKSEETKITETKKSNDIEEVVSISDDETTIKKAKPESEDKMKSPFPVKKPAVTPKQAIKKTPKAEDKSSSAGKNKKKQSVTPKMSLLNFFKPISSTEKAKTNDGDEAKMKPTSLFKENVESKGEKKEDVIVIDDESECEVIKVKTASLFKKNKGKKISEGEMMEGVRKITSPKRRSKSKSEQPEKTVELMEDDSLPPDFCLQIEDSRDVENEVNPEKGKNDAVEIENVAETRLRTTDKNKEGKSHEIENVKENKVEGDGKEIMLEKLKLPRRVPLITLASPKSKKKVADT